MVVVVGSYLAGGPLTVAVVLALTGWAWPARVLRALALSSSIATSVRSLPKPASAVMDPGSKKPVCDWISATRL